MSRKSNFLRSRTFSKLQNLDGNQWERKGLGKCGSGSLEARMPHF